MLGPAKVRRLDELVITSLEMLVPPDNPYRDLEAKLDLNFVRDWAGDLYAEGGRPSIDPVVFFKLQLILFFAGLRSERKLGSAESTLPLAELRHQLLSCSRTRSRSRRPSQP